MVVAGCNYRTGWSNLMADRRTIKQAVLDLLYPPRCHACGKSVVMGSELMICRECLAELTFLRAPLCPGCGKEMSPDAGELNRFCGACLKNKPDFDSARSFVHYKSAARTLLHRLKFSGDTGAGAALVQALVSKGEMVGRRNYDLIIPVPLHPSRLRKRGLNQSLILARLLFPGERGKIKPTALVRVKNTIAQTGLDGVARRKNLREAFAVPPSISVQARAVILVDDVYTTGTTVGECARSLKRCGAAVVDVLTIARA